MIEGGFASYAEKIDANKIRGRSPSFFDHFSQATLFFHSQSEAEQNHIVNALSFELGKVEREEIKIRVLGLLSQVDKSLVARVSDAIGVSVPKKPEQPMNRSFGADADPKKCQPKAVKQAINKSEALSMVNTRKNSIQTRQIAILAADGIDENAVDVMKKALLAEGAVVKIIAPKLGIIKGKNGNTLKVDQSFLTASSVLFDAIYIPGGATGIKTLLSETDSFQFIDETYKHCKAIALDGEAIELFKASYAGKNLSNKASEKAIASKGVIINGSPKEFIKAIAQHRFWLREKND